VQTWLSRMEVDGDTTYKVTVRFSSPVGMALPVRSSFRSSFQGR